jgi:hypothetical protein
MERFAGFLAGPGQGVVKAGQGLEEIKALYLEALGSGQWNAPASEPILARSALGKFWKFLQATRG